MVNIPQNVKNQIKFIIDSLINLIKNEDSKIKDNPYFHHTKEKKQFIIYLYLFKLLINNNNYLREKYRSLLSKYKEARFAKTNKTNFSGSTSIDVILKIKEEFKNNKEYNYNVDKNIIYFSDDKYVDAEWFLCFVSLLLDNSKNDENKEINICYTIPNRELTKVSSKEDKESFLSYFTYYNIRITHTDSSKPVKENDILILKNAAINYLKHLKQYYHGLEGPDSYKIFYNLLKNETKKEGYKLEEITIPLPEVDKKHLNVIEKVMDDAFYKAELSRQAHLIETAIWQSSNDITLLEQTNSAIDHLVDLLTYLNVAKDKTYKEVKEEHKINDIQIALILVIMKFIITYKDYLDIDYSLLDLSNVNPKYMNNIGTNKEQDIKKEIRSLELELASSKKKMEQYKEERQQLNPDNYPKDKYQKELERCVGNLNRESIIIGRINSSISSLTREYESLKKEKESKYFDADKYIHNTSIIKHITNSIIGCNFYLKTSNKSSVFNNIIIFEDYKKMDNSFYLEITFNELLKITKKDITDIVQLKSNLPKLAG